METRVCLRCGKELLLSEFHKDKARPSGRRPYCKKCRSTEEQARRSGVFSPNQWRCPKCNKVQPLDQFTLLANKYKKPVGKTKHCNTCNLEYRELHRIRHREYQKAWQKGRPRTTPRNRKPEPYTFEKRVRRAMRWYERKLHYLRQRGGRCEHCEISVEDHPVAVFDFHHTDPDKKEGTISKMLGIKSREGELIEELKMCIILCANCHRALHWREKFAEFKTANGFVDLRKENK